MVSQPPEPPSTRRHLSATQLHVYELLLDRVQPADQWVADCYISGHSILTSVDLPDAVSAAAHQFRELVENLWRIVPDFPKEEDKGSTNISETARAVLAPAWRTLACDDGDPPTLDMGRVEGLGRDGLAKLMAVVHDFVLRVLREQPIRARLVRALELVDPSGIAVPTTLQELRRKEWLSLRQFLVRACHGHRTPMSEMQERTAEFDDLLLRMLVPEGATAISELDELIAEVEGG